MALCLMMQGCSAQPALSSEAGYGPNPILPPPDISLVPSISIPPARGWPAGLAPQPAAGFAVQAFATQLDHPRWLYVLPDGGVLVAETNSPPRESPYNFLKTWLFNTGLKRAGAAGSSANRLTYLRDADGDGIAEIRSIFLEGLHSPFGMALIGNALFVANTDAILRFQWQPGMQRITEPGQKIASLPALPYNHHWTKNILASRDGKYLYATVGSNSNIGENGLQNEKLRAAILEIEIATGQTRLFASGLRNPVGMDWEPDTGALWTVVNERDELGNNLVPDYLTSVKDGGFYGWPWSYFGPHLDPRVKPQHPDRVAKAITPDYALGAHTASLGLAFSRGQLMPPAYRNGAFIGMHGSWNRKPVSGYKVVFVPFKSGRPAGMPQDILTGFLSPESDAYGRPVGVAIDARGALLVADDVGNVVWRVTPR
jgi:glucose/arabinose dehydrogenase